MKEILIKIFKILMCIIVISNLFMLFLCLDKVQDLTDFWIVLSNAFSVYILIYLFIKIKL